VFDNSGYRSLAIDNPTMTARGTPIRIASQRDQSNLSKGKKTFNALIYWSCAEPPNLFMRQALARRSFTFTGVVTS